MTTPESNDAEKLTIREYTSEPMKFGTGFERKLIKRVICAPGLEEYCRRAFPDAVIEVEKP